MNKVNWAIDSAWTLFLDRDGVINKRNFEGYITEAKDFVFNDNALVSIAGFSKIFNKIIVVTNQQGIGKGIMSRRNLLEIHDYMSETIKQEGGEITKCFFAENLKGDKEDRRKPNSAMGLEAKKMFPDIDFEKSIMVGDTDSDIQFGKNLGMKTVLISSKEITLEKADVVVDNLFEFYKLIKK